MAIFEHDGKVFDSAKAQALTFGDMAELESMGVDLQSINGQSRLPVSQTMRLALVCLRKLDDTVDEAYIKSVPLTKATELTAVITDFLGAGLPSTSAAS